MGRRSHRTAFDAQFNIGDTVTFTNGVLEGEHSDNRHSGTGTLRTTAFAWGHNSATIEVTTEAGIMHVEVADVEGFTAP